MEAKMNFQELASLIAEREGKKVETPIGNIREILSILKEIIEEDSSVLDVLLNDQEELEMGGNKDNKKKTKKEAPKPAANKTSLPAKKSGKK